MADIYDGDETMIKGLVWILILKFQVRNKQEVINWASSIVGKYDTTIAARDLKNGYAEEIFEDNAQHAET